MKLRKSAKLTAVLVLAWAVIAMANLFTTAGIMGILWLAGTVLHVRLPYTAIAVLVALVVLAVLMALPAAKRRSMRSHGSFMGS